ncbi:MAG: hypothetical protein IJ224_04550 [Lachnospiraceae bacterium]|nr:hypothetical protein [Lachnospiraceae bacterium]
MVCQQCKFDNKEGAEFCAQCGAKLIKVPDTSNLEEKIESKSEESTTILTADMLEDTKGEESTTVLTADMLNQAPSNGTQGKVPQGGQPGMVPPMQPGQGPMGGQPGMTGQLGQNPMNGQSGMLVQQQGKPAKPAKQQKAPKPAKEAKQPKQKSGKLGGGMIAYIVISLLLILGMAGAGVWGYLHYTKEIDKITDEKDSISKELDSKNALVTSKEDEIAGLESTNSDLEEENASLQTQVADYEAQVSELSSTNDKYAPLIDFANNKASGQGYDDFFVSDTVVHLSKGATSVKVFFSSEEGTVNPAVADGGVATCSWQDASDESGNVATLDITPVATGITTISISNDINDETITILVIVD